MGAAEDCVCCAESASLRAATGEKQCITQVGMFDHVVVNEHALRFSRFQYAMGINDDVEKGAYLSKTLNNRYKSIMCAFLLTIVLIKWLRNIENLATCPIHT